MHHDLDERLTHAQIAWFSSVRPDGSPHTVPVWFIHDDESIWVASAPSSRKVANVSRNDRVAIAIDGSAPRTLVAQTSVELIDDPEEHPSIVAGYARKYSGYDLTDHSVAGPLVLMRLTITRWLLDGSAQ
ncbi:pyridoxamine 5'-phosphate oxidase family protein [uncultured Cellulomonas sp.]|uniref:pyridoxamine 5'-phosphate oxidase family protein n=1 Tax=uncultured Cellulomonas sp. TaxID=189682 RepID=UPI00262E1BCA|nr:pyridoxamine 5'-phosphate oxidase family protein [uncultured Cellulomonas sp.]